MSALTVNGHRQLIDEAVHALVVAWRNSVAYAPGHPALTASFHRARRTLTELTLAAGPLAVGVGRNGLLLGERRLESIQARTLARALGEHQVAVLRIEHGVETADLHGLFRLLRTAAAGEQPLWERLGGVGVRHIELQPLDYSTVRANDETRPEEPGAGESRPLHDRLVYSLLEAGSSSPLHDAVWGSILQAFEEVLDEPEAQRAAAAVLDAAPGDAGLPADGRRPAAVDGSSGSPVSAAEARRLTSWRAGEIFARLPEPLREVVLDSAVRALLSSDHPNEALDLLLSPFSPDVVLASFQRLEVEGVPLSPHVLALVRRLRAAEGPALAGWSAGETGDPVLEELRALLAVEDVDRYNPSDHQVLLTRMGLDLAEGLEALPTPVDIGDRLDSLSEDNIVRQSASTTLEILAGYDWPDGCGPVLARLENSCRLFLARGCMDAAAEAIEALSGLSGDQRLPPDVRVEMQGTLARLASLDGVALLLDAMSPRPATGFLSAARILGLLEPESVRSLLVLLAEEPRRAQRRRIFDLLVALGPVAAPHAVGWLGDSRWYMVRNMLALLRHVGEGIPLPDLGQFVVHPDPRVRVEALKLVLAFDVRVPGPLVERACTDEHPKVLEVSVGLISRQRRTDMAAFLVRLVRRWDPFGRQRHLRLSALRALGELGDAAVLPRLARFFRRWQLLSPVSPEERRAAFESLRLYPSAARQKWVHKGLRSRDPVIRKISHHLSG